MLLSMTKVSASVVVHESDEDEPVWIVPGLAESVQVGAAGGGGVLVTVTVVEHVTEPPEPVAVPVYVVEVVGETEVLPEATGVTEPTLLSIEKEVALVVVHESDEDEPVWIVPGLADSVQVGAAGGGGGIVTVTAAEQVVSPPGPETVNVKSVVAATVTD
jgi:2-keto-3-deoxy-galactonokinase